ncbi:MAG: C39 family peptidase [Elusimicrobia bacterium]|nr:C39 family peptidase [Elusimicrobiota bacterium]
MALGMLAAMAAWGVPAARGAAASGKGATRTAQLKESPGLKLIRLPKTRQATDYTCGVAALQSVLAFFGEELREDQLAKELKPTPENGTDFRVIAKVAEEHGLKVSVRKGAGLADLRAALDAGSPALVSIQAWADAPQAEPSGAQGKALDQSSSYAEDWKDGHYVVAVGYDAKNFYFMDPSLLGHYGFIPAAELEARWHDEESPGERISGLMLVFSGKAHEGDPDAILLIE